VFASGHPDFFMARYDLSDTSLETIAGPLQFVGAKQNTFAGGHLRFGDSGDRP